MSISASECGMDEVDTATELKHDIVVHDDAALAFDRAMAARKSPDRLYV